MTQKPKYNIPNKIKCPECGCINYIVYDNAKNITLTISKPGGKNGKHCGSNNGEKTIKN